MTKPIRFFLIIFGLLGLGLSASHANAQQAIVSGEIVASQTSKAIPGLSVYLVHPRLGRSVAAISDNFGKFVFYDIPFHNEQYYIEVYWGDSVRYRNPLSVSSSTVSVGRIRL